MSYMLKEMPNSIKPRERLEKYGPSSLSDYELLAILLRTGYKNQSVIDVAKNILIEYEFISSLNDTTIQELTKIKGIGKIKAIEILATIELGKRINNGEIEKKEIKVPKDAYLYIKNKLENLKQETLIVIYLNTKSEIITSKTLSIGTVNQTIINPREILKWSVKYSSQYFIISHNHPSGDPSPSQQDIEMTKKLANAAKMMDIKLIDHIIIGKNKYFSFIENNIKF